MIKCVTSNGLVELATEATKLGYNRQLDLKELAERIDRSGVHILQDLLLHEHAQGNRVGGHVRCRVLIKMIASDDPVAALLDVELGRFNALPDAEAALAAAEAEEAEWAEA